MVNVYVILYICICTVTARYQPEVKKALGGELLAARFAVGVGGHVKLYNDDHTYSKKTSKVKVLPSEKTDGLVVEAIDLSGTQLIYEGFQNLCKL